MKIKRIHAVYFSPCGSTALITTSAAKTLAGRLQAETNSDDFTLPDTRKNIRHYRSDELIIFGMPTYAGRVPNKLLGAVQALFHGRQTPAVILVTYGNRNFDSSLTELQCELQKNNFQVLAAGAFPARHVFSDKIAAGRPDQHDRALLSDFSIRAAEKLEAADDASKLTAPIINDGAPVGPYYKPLGTDGKPANFLKAKPKTNDELCDHCGLCAKLCPMGSISPEQTDEIPGLCIKCHACIRKCPKHAKYFDDTAFLSHQAMLEANYTKRREPQVFL